MSIPVIAIITSRSCGHCMSMRGTGSLKENSSKTPGPIRPGGYYWSPSFMKKLLTGNASGTGPAKVKVFEIFYQNLESAPPTHSNEVSTFELADGTVKRTTYRPNNGGTLVTVEKGEGKVVGEQKLDTNFESIIAKMVPNDLSSLLHFFPGWYWFDGMIWNEAIAGAPLYGYSPFLKIVQDTSVEGKTKYKPGAPTSNNEDVVTVTGKVLRGEISLQPPPLEPRRPVTITLPTAAPDSCPLINYTILSGW